MRLLILGRSVRLKGKTNKKNHKKSRRRRPWCPRMTLKVNIDIFGLSKRSIYCKNVPVLVRVFLYAVNMLNFQIKIIISSEKWCNYFVTFFFFGKCQKIGSVDDAKRRKKKREDGHNKNKK